MTCGFIVVCVPCVPKILLESGVWRKVKQRLGMSVTAAPSKPKNTTAGSTVRSKNMRSVNNSYLEIDDDTELKNLGSESTEHLRDPYSPGLEKGIVRTTQVTVTQNPDLSNSNETVYDRRQWR